MARQLLHAWAEHYKPYADDQQCYGDRGRDLRSLLFVNGRFDGADFRYLFLLVIVETGVDEANHTQDEKNDSEDDCKTFHKSEPIITAASRVKNADKRTSAPVWRGSVLIELQQQRRPWLRWRPCDGA